MIRFVDQATIEVAAGRGGKGCRSYYRDLWTRHPIPDGGDGGRGGDVIIRANPQLTTLLDFLPKRSFKAGSGSHASSKRKHGARGSECLVEVPLGTLVWDAHTGDLIQELTLQANKARQWRITEEMLEIASGAEAMAKG